MVSNFFPPKIVPCLRYVQKWGASRQFTDGNIIWRMRTECRIRKATNTHRICNTYCFSTATMVAWTRLVVTLVRTLPVFFQFQERVLNGGGASWRTGNWRLESVVSSLSNCPQWMCSRLYLMVMGCVSPRWHSTLSPHPVSPSAERAPK